MFARTARLMLRPAWAEDAPALARAIGEESVVRNLATAPWPYTPADAEAFVRAPREAGLPDFLIFARTRGSPRLVGGIGLFRHGGAIELGYWIARPCWGLGFATEAGRAVVALAEQSLRIGRLVAGHTPDNPASGNVLRKLGFTATGQVTMRASRVQNALVPVLGYVRKAGAAHAPLPLAA